MRRRWVRRIGIVAGAFAGVIAAWLTVAAIVYSPTYVMRVLQMRESSQADYLENFPVRTLAASSRPYRYAPAPDLEVARQLAAVFETDDIDQFLTSTATQALLVITNDSLVVEWYGNGAERDTMLTSFSVAKSFDSALVGIAIDEGFIASVDDPITDYLPELADDDHGVQLSRITVADLLSMSSGLDYHEMRWAVFNGDDPLTTYHPDQQEISLAAATRLVDEPGRYFRYNKYHPQLLGMILERTTGMTVSDYTESRLWEPLGMEYDGQWTLDRDDGFEKMEAGLNARAIDFAKLGSLYLAGGSRNGDRIVSEEWVAASVSPTPERIRPDRYRDDFGRWINDDGNGWYGYFWYGRARDDNRFDFFAEGDHGQFIYVCPRANTVVVRIGTEFGLPGSRWIDAFQQFCGRLTESPT
ncbi:MAG: beta-lactamase family protein [Acidimicrobiia bacterium]|nr:beta-lactamase family protein [Acidimicrobiia bacterium]